MKGKKWVSLLLAGAMAACAMGGTAAFAEESETQTTAAVGEDAAAAEEVPVVDSVEEAAEVLGVEDAVPTENVTVSVGTDDSAAATTTAPAVTTTAVETTVTTVATTATFAKAAAGQEIQTTVFSGEEQGVAPTNYYDDVVLMLDVSGSMYGDPMEAMKDAAAGICEKFLQADPSTVISIVAFSDDVQYLQYSSNLTQLVSYIRSLQAGGRTNMYDAMSRVKLILNQSNGKQKSVIIMADGMPNEGSDSYTIDYNYDSHQNATLQYDNFNLKTAATVYSIGFFEDNYSDSDAQFVRDLASDPKYGYIVENASDLEGVFTTIFQNISSKNPNAAVATGTTATTGAVSASPKTGDTGVGMIVGIMFLSACGLAYGMTRSKKQK